MPADTPPLLTATDLRHTLGTGADAFTLALPKLELRPGAHAVCIGPSGSGKTTLLRMLAGITTPHAGEIRLRGERWSALPEPERRKRRLRELGLVFQHFALLEYRSMLGNILLPANMTLPASERRDARARAESLADRLGIAHTLRRRPADASHGERQRAAICRALVLEPTLLLCDEPTSSLDPARAGEALDLVLEVATAVGATALVVTHDHALADRFTTTLRLDAGRAA